MTSHHPGRHDGDQSVSPRADPRQRAAEIYDEIAQASEDALRAAYPNDVALGTTLDESTRNREVVAQRRRAGSHAAEEA